MSDFTGVRIIFHVRRDGSLGLISPYLYAERLSELYRLQFPGCDPFVQVLDCAAEPISVALDIPGVITESVRQGILLRAQELAQNLKKNLLEIAGAAREGNR